MLTQPAAFSVLSAPVALCDRRALSQAWYSALHVHKDGAPANVTRRETRALVQDEPAHAYIQRTGFTKNNPEAQKTCLRVGAALALPGAPANERRILRSKLAQKIERVFLEPKHPPKHASFSLEGARGRVQILLQQTGSHTRIVALCPPEARDLVARALSQARYALALRGMSVQSDIRGFAR